MTLERLYAALAAIGYPVAYRTMAGPQGPPYIVYNEAYTRPIPGGDELRAQIVHYEVWLYTAGKQPDTERAVEDALRSIGIIYEKSEEGVHEQKLVSVLYEFEEVNHG